MGLSTRPETLSGYTYKIKLPNLEGNLINVYVTINEHDGKPFEIFLNCSDAGLYEWFSQSMIQTSKLLQAGVSAEEVASDLQEVHSTMTGHFIPGGGGHCPSLSARIGLLLKQHIGRGE